MSNNDTLNGALTTLGELMATNLNIMDVPDAQASDGLTTLANKILDIPRFVNVVSFTVAGDVDIPEFNPLYDGDNLVVLYGDDSYDSYTTGGLNHSYTDGESSHTVYVVGGLVGFGDGCFSGYTGLTSVVIPDGVSSLGDECFEGCTGLDTVTIPNTVTNIGDDCFKDCIIGDYELYWVGDEILSYDSNKMPTASNTIFTIPQGEKENYITAGYPADKLKERGVSPMIVLEYTGSSIMIGNNSLNWLPSEGDVIVDWGDGTTDTINNPTTKLTHTYSDGENNHTIRLIGEITRIANGCFSGCTGLTNIIFSNSITSLGIGCFSDCTGLTRVTIPNNIISIEQLCFVGCTSLTSIILPDNLTSLSDNCFTNCSSLTSINIPDSVTSISSACFHGCTNLTSIALPDSVTSLGDYCFTGCTHLTKVTIPDSVTSIGRDCFYGCTSLVDYQLYWTANNIINYNARIMPVNTGTIFTIPQGETTNYTNKGYPADKIQERS